MPRHFATEQWVPVEISIVFRFFANPQNLPRIMPPSTDTRLLSLTLIPPPGISGENLREPLAGVGSEIVTSFRLLPFLPIRKRWVARITEFEWNHHFADEQQQGPFNSFRHRHELASEVRDGQLGTSVSDVIDYEIGFGPLDHILDLFVTRILRQTFRYRQSALDKLLRSALSI